MQPETQVPARDIAPIVSDLLVARTMHLLHVMEILFYGRTIGHALRVQSTHDQLQEAPHESRRQVSSPPFLKRTMPDSPREESEQIKEPDDPVPGTGPRVDAESSQNQP